MNTMPDMVQTFAVVAACADGPSHVANVANLRVKETDRLTGLKKDLHAVGIKAEDSEDSLTIWGGSPHGGLISTFDDHRMAMAFAALGTRIPGIVIDKSEVVSKSYPNFWVDLERIGIQLNRNPS